MFRLVSYEEDSELTKYLSSIASNTIYEELCEWVRSPKDLMEVYSLYFCVMPAGIRNADFFEGIAGHLQLDESGKEADARFSGWFSEWSADEDLSEDDLAGIRFLWMKIERMKEKMLDQNTYFTFDLFEEYLFALLIEEGTIPDGNDDDDSEGDHFSEVMTLEDASWEDFFEEEDPLEGDTFDGDGFDDDLSEEDDFNEESDFKKFGEAFRDYLDGIVSSLRDVAEKENAILKTKSELTAKYGFDEDEADWTATAVHCVGCMGLGIAEDEGYESLFFWDDDFSILFANSDTFIEAVHLITGGIGAAMGYGYENVAEIFTDAGYKLPIWLIGTHTAFDLREEDIKERMRRMPTPLPDVGFKEPYSMEDEDLPFS